MNPYEPLDDVPSLGLSLHDMYAIHTMVTSYMASVRKEGVASNKRDAEMALLAGIRGRMLTTVLANGGTVPLSAEEIQALANAMQGFATLTRQLIEPSAEREGMLKQVSGLRQHLLRMLAGRRN